VKQNPLKQKLERDEVVVVVNPDHTSPSLTEFMAGLGIDGVFIDCEHGMATIERVNDMCRAARAGGIQSIVRPETFAYHLLNRYLDAGADGLIVPHVDTAKIAASVVSAVRTIRYNDHASKVIIVMIESPQAVQNLSSILMVEGVDVFFVGPDDLSRSMGYAGQMTHPKVQEVIADVATRVRAAGKVPGILVTDLTVARHVAQGYRFLYEHLNNFARTGAREFLRLVPPATPGENV
jgi:2-keto-3-deoxy-L-rhamnonate aldolase RhmA